ncbi:hypothetical protein CC86DRAFT_387439 [Ophiobolus disseminans]|uniref:DUF8021 domain-containing protein n=1 Tax=Ophiobolus disseminans TaxID=1469910 RepID=A0A6A6ZH99_9PLEO|nr:hypothetical protein CC86DRAFT_387439 [Ophiobolus disseminans]
MIPTLLAAATLLASSSAHCTRPQLIEAVNAYLTTQTTGQTAPFTSRFDNSTWLGYFENSLKTNISTSILTTPLPITFSRSIYDTTSCATFTEVIVNSTSVPHVIGTQLRFTNHKINKIDTIITKPGDWLFNVTGYALYSPREPWTPIPTSSRDSRTTLKAAADAYLDIFNSPNTTVPWGIPCVRLEGGLYGDEGPNGTCAGFIPTGVPITNRRYVVDEEMGAVDVMVDFGASRWPDSHEFRVEGGRLRYVHTLTHCGRANCGVGNGTVLRV